MTTTPTTPTPPVHYVPEVFGQQTHCGIYVPMTPPIRPTGPGRTRVTTDPDAVTCPNCNATAEAETLGRVTGSVAATVTREHRDAGGNLVTDSVGVWTRGTK